MIFAPTSSSQWIIADAVREVTGVIGVALLGSAAVTVAGPTRAPSALLDGVRVAAAVSAALVDLAGAVTASSTVFSTPTDVVRGPAHSPLTDGVRG